MRENEKATSASYDVSLTVRDNRHCGPGWLSNKTFFTSSGTVTSRTCS